GGGDEERWRVRGSDREARRRAGMKPGPDRAARLLLIFACTLHLVLGALLAATNLPLCDEGFYGIPAHFFAKEGILRDPVLESAGMPYLTGLDRVFHWMPPLGMVIQGT